MAPPYLFYRLRTIQPVVAISMRHTVALSLVTNQTTHTSNALTSSKQTVGSYCHQTLFGKRRNVN